MRTALGQRHTTRMKHGGLLGIGVCAALALGCGKSDKKAAPEQTAPPVTTPATTPATPAKSGGGLAGLFGKKAAPAKADKASPIRGLFGGGMDLGGGTAVAAAEADRLPEPEEPIEPSGKPNQAAVTPSGDCAKAADHLAAVLKKEMGEDIPPEMASEMRTQIAQMCTTDKWPAAGVQCVLAATTMQALEACESQLPYGSGDDGDDGDDGDVDDDDFEMPDLDMGSSEPVPSGDAKCDAIASHAWTLMMADQTMIPADQKAMMEGMKVQITNMIAAECVKQKFPEAAKDCILAAKTIKDTEGCGI